MQNKEQSGAYLPPEEQREIAFKINRLCCALEPKDFDPETQVADAQTIVKALHPRIKPQGKFRLIIHDPPSSSSSVFTGATDIGTSNVSLEKKKLSKQVQFGVNEYKIGEYVACKSKGKKISSISFEHFWDRGGVNLAFDKYPKHSSILYDNESLDILKISLSIPITKGNFLVSFTYYKEIILWEKPKNNLKK